MKNNIIIGLLLIVALGSLGWYFNKTDSAQIACTMEAKICPDGTAVGRSGPRCEFTKCPTIQTATTAKINQKILNNGVYITPLEVVSDSRCPSDVVCIWAGTVTLKTSLQMGINTEEKTLELNKPVSFAGKTVELVAVTPGSHSKTTIGSGDYRFEFSVK